MIGPLHPPARLGALTVDTGTWTVTFEGAPVRLTNTELRVLWVLARAQGATVPRQRLLSQVWGAGYSEHDALDAQLLRVNVSRLRERLPDVRINLVGMRQGWQLHVPAREAVAA